MVPILAQPRDLDPDLLQPLFEEFDLVLGDGYDLGAGRAELLALELAKEPSDERVDARGVLRRIADDDAFGLRIGLAGVRLRLRERRTGKRTDADGEQRCGKNCRDACCSRGHPVLCRISHWPTTTAMIVALRVASVLSSPWRMLIAATLIECRGVCQVRRPWVAARRCSLSGGGVDGQVSKPHPCVGQVRGGEAR